MEAGALRAPAALTRISVTAPFLRLRSDEQLVALFRAGNEDAFTVIHDRYRQRLFAYARQMLGGSRQDAEDALQDVYLRAYSSLRSNDRPLSLRAWLYRVAHNRCIDHLRRPTPPSSDLFDTSRKPLHDPIDEAERREDLRQLIADVRRLPEQQRSALLMREIDGLSYAELGDALGVSLQAVKSLLVRARIGLVEAVEARDTACSEIRVDLADSFDRGVRTSGLARRHLRDCEGCVAYRTQLRTVRQCLGVLAPGGPGPFAAVLKLIGLGGAGSAGAASAGGGAAAGSGALAAAGSGTAVKFAAVVCCAALTAGGAVEVHDSIVAPSGGSTTGARVAAPASSQQRTDRALRAAPAIAAAQRAAPATPTAAKETNAAQPTVGRHIRSVPPQSSAVAPVMGPSGAGQHTVDASTGGASAPREDTGFGYGADGMTPRAAPRVDTAPAPGVAPSSGTGEGASARPAPGDAIGGGESRHAASAQTAEPAAGPVPPG